MQPGVSPLVRPSMAGALVPLSLQCGDDVPTTDGKLIRRIVSSNYVPARLSRFGYYWASHELRRGDRTAPMVSEIERPAMRNRSVRVHRMASRSRLTALASGAPLLLLGGATLVLSACSSPGTVATPSPHSSPAAVTSAYLNLLDAGGAPSICDLFIPSAQADCKRVALPENFFASYSGTAVAGASVTVGAHAFVAVTGETCTKQRCSHNDNPNKGLPSAKAFASVWANQNLGTFLVRCEEVSGKWYVDPAPSSVSTSTAGATGSVAGG